MREIKFRACDAQKKKMLGDFPIVVCVGNDVVILVEYMPDANSGSWIPKAIYQATNEQLEDLHVMQFTGLQDKNGKDIYEGDLLILNTNRDAVFEVFYHDGDGCFSCARPHYFGSQGGGYVPPLNSKGLEVIGNICENPDLLA